VLLRTEEKGLVFSSTKYEQRERERGGGRDGNVKGERMSRRKRRKNEEKDH